VKIQGSENKMGSVNPGVKALLHPARFKRILNVRDLKHVEKLPVGYQKFYKEWREREPEPVHWIPRQEKWERNAETGEVKPVQNIPIPTKYPHQVHDGLWGGEGVVQGLVKKAKYRSPVPRFWVPKLQESVVYSEILDKYMEIVVTERALRLIDENFGLDNYLLKTPACDIQSLTALKLKRRILLALANKDFSHGDVKRQEELYEKYKQYVVPREEAEWYGLSVKEAVARFNVLEKNAKAAEIKPLKYQLRLDLLQSLDQVTVTSAKEEKSSSWMSKLNPFSKPENAEKS